MTQDEIIEMARQAGFEIFIQESPDGLSKTVRLPPIKPLEAFAKLVASKEREACALLAQKTVYDTHIPTGVKIYGTAAAKAIRARGEP